MLATLTLNSPHCGKCGEQSSNGSNGCHCHSHGEHGSEEAETFDFPTRSKTAWGATKKVESRERIPVTHNGENGEELLDLPAMNWKREVSEETPTVNDAGAELLELPSMRW